MYKHIKNILITWLLLLSVGAFASTEITLNSTINGALTEDSYIDADGNRAKYYTFTLSEAKNIVLEINATFSGKIKLKNEQEETLKSSSIYLDISRFSKYLEAGTYSIKVRNNSTSDFGTFTLTYKENVKHIQSISLGQTLQGSLTENSYFDKYGYSAEYYSFTLEEAQNIVIDSNNSTLIELHNTHGKPITESYTSFLSKYLEAGDYLIKVYYSELKNFTLNMYINHPKHIQPISLDETLTGEFTNNSYIDDYGYKAEYYSFTLEEAQNIVIDSNSHTITTSLIAVQGGETIGYSYHSSLSKYLEAGEYLIRVSSSSQDTFSLHIRENNKHTQPISLDETLTGEFTDNSYIGNNGYKAEYYSFTLTESKDIVIQSHSDFHTYIALKDAQGNTIIADSSSGSANNALITTHLEAGNYSIKIHSYSSDRLDSFSLSLNENIIEEQSITLDTLVTDRLTIDSGISPQSSNYTKYYTFTLTKATSIDMVLKSSDFLVKLYLLDSNNKLIVGSPDSYSHSTYSETINHNLEAGTYTVAVSTKYSDKVGAFTLEIKDLGKYAWLIPAVYTPMLLN